MILPIPASPPTQLKRPYVELEKIRFSQSCLLKGLLVQILGALFGSTFRYLPEMVNSSVFQALCIPLLIVLFVACCGTLYGFFSLLTKVVEPSKQGSYTLGFIIGLLLPLINLFLIASVSTKANSILTGNGYKVNLLGAKKLSEEEVTLNLATNSSTLKPARIPGKSGYHTIANYGLWLTPVALVVGAIAIALPEGLGLALGVISGFMLLAVPITGVIALCGVPTQGKPKLLWKGLVLTIIPAVFFIIVVILVPKKDLQNQNGVTTAQPYSIQTLVQIIQKDILENLRKEPSLAETLEFRDIHANDDNVTIYFIVPNKSLSDINEELFQQSYVPILHKYLYFPDIAETQARTLRCTILDKNGEIVISSKIWN